MTALDFNAMPRTGRRLRKDRAYTPAALRPSHFLASAAASELEAEFDATGVAFTREDRRADGIVAFLVDGVEVASVCAVTDEPVVSIEMITHEFREALRRTARELDGEDEQS